MYVYKQKTTQIILYLNNNMKHKRCFAKNPLTTQFIGCTKKNNQKEIGEREVQWCQYR